MNSEKDCFKSSGSEKGIPRSRGAIIATDVKNQLNQVLMVVMRQQNYVSCGSGRRKAQLSRKN